MLIKCPLRYKAVGWSFEKVSGSARLIESYRGVVRGVSGSSRSIGVGSKHQYPLRYQAVGWASLGLIGL